MIIVDAHQDIAWNMLTFGRDYTRSAEETRRCEAGSQQRKRDRHALGGGFGNDDSPDRVARSNQCRHRR